MRAGSATLVATVATAILLPCPARADDSPTVVQVVAPHRDVGEVTVSSVSDTTVTLVPATFPKSTSVAPVRYEPVTVTVVPPVAGPEVGEIDVTVGGT